jgi:isopentenyl-diphosphate delta-isomerase
VSTFDLDSFDDPVLVQAVDGAGITIGTVEKLQAHVEGGVLHRAVSVMIFDADDRLLLQRRSATKYHFAGLWANTCCTHPSPTETAAEAAQRALKHELGIEPDVREVTALTYTAHDEVSGYTEREFDHVLVGTWGGDVDPCPDEVQGIDWVSGADFANWLREKPDEFVPWLPHILSAVSNLANERLDAVNPLARFIRAFDAAIVSNPTGQ